MITCPSAIAREMARLQFTCLNEVWVSRQTVYRFRCPKGHVLAYQGASLAKVRGCRICRRAMTMQRLKRDTKGRELSFPPFVLRELLRLNFTRVDMQWLGLAATYRFRCNVGHVVSYVAGSLLKLKNCPECRQIEKAERLKLRAQKEGLSCPPSVQRELARLQFTCLDTQWRTVHTACRFRCRQGHILTCPAKSLRELYGCHACRADERMRRLEQRSAQDGSQCLDLESPWAGVGKKYRFRCLRDPSHEWLRTYPFALRNAGCPHCSLSETTRKRIDIDGLQRLQAAAKRQGGECLASEFIGVNHKYRFRCANGHIWAANGARILRGENWCRKCHSLSIRLTLEDMRQAAAAHGGQCLSTKYHMNSTHYVWLCVRGHTWRATFANVRAGTWCPTCAHMSHTKVGSAAWRRYQAHVFRE